MEGLLFLLATAAVVAFVVGAWWAQNVIGDSPAPVGSADWYLKPLALYFKMRRLGAGVQDDQQRPRD